MSHGSDQDVFTYVWRIENFSMCPQKKREWIKSPDFVVDALDKTIWHLKLYPKGDFSTNGDCLSCFLWRGNKKEMPNKITICYDIKLLTLNTKSYTVYGSVYAFENSDSHGYSNLKTLKDLSESKNTMLPHDALTILCFMWREKSSGKKTKLINVMAPRVNYTCSMDKTSTYISEVSVSSDHRVNNCMVNTRIPVERDQLKWIIKDFRTQMQTKKKISASVASSLRKKSELLLHCYLSSVWNGHGSVRIDIQRKETDTDLKEMLLKCKVSVIDNLGAAQESQEHQHLFGRGYEIWTLPPVIKLSTLQMRSTKLLKGQNFTLQFEFTRSNTEEEKINGKAELQIIGSVDRKSLRQDICCLLKGLKFPDVTLIGEGLELLVHKSVICTWSRVFEAMFKYDTEEKQTGVVRITDIEGNTLRHLKHFMYGSELPELQPEDAMKLYSAADKYEILTLKKQCATSLKCSLSVSNVCDVLVLADLHEDAQLLKYVKDFLRKHSLEVFKSAKWINLMETNHKLAGETMRTLIATQTSSLS